MGAVHKSVEVREGPKHGIDTAIIGDVITEVAHWGSEEGRQPHRVYAEARDMVQMRGDPRQVADAVAVEVGETARIDLVDCGAAPPRRGGGRLCVGDGLLSEHRTPHSRARAG